MANKKLNATITIGGAVSGSLRGAFGTVKKNTVEIGSAISKLSREQRQLNEAMKRYGQDSAIFSRMKDRYQTVVGQVERLRSATERLKRVEDARERNLAKRQGYKEGILGTVALGATVAVPIKQAMDFEDTLADIRKVANFETPDGLVKMGQAIQDMSTKMPMAANEIGKIVAAGAQSGIATSELTKFAESAIKMGVAFDVSADQAGQAMAEMRAAFGMTQDQMNVLADKINYLGNNTAASAKDILEITQRIGPLGSVAGAASGSIAAMGATLRGMGVQNEIAATGIKNLLLSLTAGASATKSQREAFKQLGFTSKQVAKSMQLNADETIRVILSKISKLPKHMQAATLSQLFGKESIGAIAPMLTQLDTYQKNLDMVKDKTKYAGSMQAEYEAATAKTSAQLKIFNNRVSNLGVTIGTVLLPAFNGVLATVGPVIGKVAELAREYPTVTKAVVIGSSALVALRVATFAAGFAFTFLKGGLLNVSSLFARMNASAVLASTRGLPAVATGVRAIGAAFISTGIGALITGLALGGLWIYRNWAGVKAFMTGTLQGIQQGLQPVTEKFQALWDKLGPVKTAFQWVADAAGKAWDWFTKLAEPVSYSGEELKKAGDAGQQFGKALAAGIDFVLGPIQFLIDKIIWVSDNIGNLTNKALEFKNAVSDVAGGAWQKTKDFFSNPFGDDESSQPVATAAPGASLPSPALANRTGNTTVNTNDQYTINVKADPGMNEDALANKVAQKLKQQQGIRNRSMMPDGFAAP